LSSIQRRVEHEIKLKKHISNIRCKKEKNINTYFFVGDLPSKPTAFDRPSLRHGRHASRSDIKWSIALSRITRRIEQQRRELLEQQF
jgi:hypothetical protein